MAAQALAGTSVLVTGGSGFIGSAVCRELLRHDAHVHATSRTPLVQQGVRWQACDLADPEATRRLLRSLRPELVLHLASHVTGTRAVEVVLPTFQDNLSSTVNLLVAAEETACARVVLVGSLEEPERSAGWSVPRSPYAAAKHAAAVYGRMFHALYDLPVTMLRVAMVYGPGQRDTRKLVPYAATSLLTGRVPRLTSGTRQADWIHVADVVDAILATALAPGVDGLTLDVGTGRLTTVRRVVELIFERIRPDLVPEFGALADRAMDQMVEAADADTTFKYVGWRPEIALEAGLNQTIDWYRCHLEQEEPTSRFSEPS